jgi:hypothetical protein
MIRETSCVYAIRNCCILTVVFIFGGCFLLIVNGLMGNMRFSMCSGVQSSNPSVFLANMVLIFCWKLESISGLKLLDDYGRFSFPCFFLKREQIMGSWGIGVFKSVMWIV